MQVTGSNTGEHQKILSIRLSPNGLSFWVAQADESAAKVGSGPIPDANNVWDTTFDPSLTLAENTLPALNRCRETLGENMPTRKVIYLDTLQTILIPTELAETRYQEGYLAQNGLVVDESETVFRSEFTGPGKERITSLSIFNSEAGETCQQQLGDNCEFSSPYALLFGELSVRPSSSRLKCGLYLTPTHVYLAIANSSGKLVYTEAMPYSTEADILYYLHVISQQIELAQGRIEVYGRGKENLCKRLRKYYKEVRCE